MIFSYRLRLRRILDDLCKKSVGIFAGGASTAVTGRVVTIFHLHFSIEIY